MSDYYPPRRNTAKPVSRGQADIAPARSLYPDPRLEPDTYEQAHDRWLDDRDRAADKAGIDPWGAG
jgi:hypothetical protein